MTPALFLIATPAYACGEDLAPQVLGTIIVCFILLVLAAFFVIRPYLDWRTAREWDANRARAAARYAQVNAEWARQKAEKERCAIAQEEAAVPDALREAREATQELFDRAQKLMEEL